MPDSKITSFLGTISHQWRSARKQGLDRFVVQAAPLLWKSRIQELITIEPEASQIVSDGMGDQAFQVSHGVLDPPRCRPPTRDQESARLTPASAVSRRTDEEE